MKVLVIFLIFFIAISINESYAEMSYSEFQNFCKETENMNFDLMPVDQRLLASLCDFLELGLPEKYWDWIGSDLDWKNFAQNVSNEYAQEIPLFVEKGHKDSLIVNTSISGRDSFPPPMSAYISFYYDEDNKTKRFGEKYTVKITGEMIKTKDFRLPPLKLFDIGYHLDEIQCKQNLVLIQKYDGTPACVTESTKQKLIERGWTTKDSSAQEIIERLKQNTQPVNEVDARYIETLALMNQTVSNFVHGVDWTSQCCGYSENDGSYQITITFLDLENQKQLGVTFDAETMKITDIQKSNTVSIGKGLSSEPDPYRLVILREFPDESAYYHKINSLSEIPYLPEINESKTTIIASEQFNDLLEWFPQKCLENNSDSYDCSNTPPIFEYDSTKYLIVSHGLDSNEVYCESGLLHITNYEKEFPDRKLEDFVPVKCVTPPKDQLFDK